MSKRGLAILAAALAVLLLLVVLGQRGPTPGSTAGAAIVPGLAAALNDVERVTLVKAGGTAVATLERRGETWVVAEKNGYPADVAKLRQGLRALADAKILETKTANPELYDRLGVADVAAADGTGVSVALTAAGKDLATLILGDAEGSKYRYARRADEAQSYLLDRDPSFPNSTAQWLAATIVDVRGERVQQVTIAHPDGEKVTVSKADAAAQNFDVAGIPASRELLYPGVANVIGNSLRELNLEDVDQAATGAPAEKPMVVEFRTFDGLVVRVTGSERDDAAWVELTASFDAEQAARFAPPKPAEGGAAPADGAPNAPEGAPSTPAAAASDADIQAEAERINTRVGGWRYKIAGFQYDQMTRRLADLLKPPA